MKCVWSHVCKNPPLGPFSQVILYFVLFRLNTLPRRAPFSQLPTRSGGANHINNALPSFGRTVHVYSIYSPEVQRTTFVLPEVRVLKVLSYGRVQNNLGKGPQGRVGLRVRVGIFPDLRRKISANEMRLEPRMQKPAPGALFPGYFAQLSYFSD